MVLRQPRVSLQSQQKRYIHLITAEDIVQPPISIGPDATVYDGIEKIIDNRISGIIVESEQGGILSARDIGKILISKNQNTKKIQASEVMQEIPLIDQYAPIPNCANMMLVKKVNTIGIRGKKGIKGIMTKHDLVRHYYETVRDTSRIQDVMTYGSFYVQDDSSMYDGLAKMITNQVSRMIIRNSCDEPIGIVTFGDFLGKVFRFEMDTSSVFYDYGKSSKITDVMTRQIITVTSQTSLSRIAKILLEYRVHGVAITDRRKIIGFVTEKDIVRELARQEF